MDLLGSTDKLPSITEDLHLLLAPEQEVSIGGRSSIRRDPPRVPHGHGSEGDELLTVAMSILDQQGGGEDEVLIVLTYQQTCNAT